MNHQQVLLALALQEAAVPLNVSTFDDRLILQKTVYLLQIAGLNFGYRYRWYLRGPYSSEVASDAFALAGKQDEQERELKRWTLDDESKAKIVGLKALIHPNSKRPRSQHLELLASVAFLVKTQQAPRDSGELSRVLKVSGKPFDQFDVTEALAELSLHGLVS